MHTNSPCSEGPLLEISTPLPTLGAPEIQAVPFSSAYLHLTVPCRDPTGDPEAEFLLRPGDPQRPKTWPRDWGVVGI